MADLSRKTASIYINHKPAQDALIDLQKQADGLQQKIKKGEAAGKSMVKEIAKLNKVQDDIRNVQTQIDKGLRPSFNQLTTTVSKLRNELKRMSEDAPGYAAKFKEFNKASTELDRLGRSIGSVKNETGGLKGILSQALPVVGIAAAFTSITGFLSSAVTEAIEAEKANARLKNTLDNLGKTEVFDRLSAKADSMAERFKFIDNDDVIGVFEQLITYGKLTENQINDLTPVIINFAAKSQISLSESASVIIKALEGNGKALKEYGIDIKDAGSETERLNVIMTTLKSKVDGAADAFGNTMAGQAAAAEQNIKNLKEEIGTGLQPIVTKWYEFLNKIVTGASAVINSKNLSTFEKFKAFFSPASGVEQVEVIRQIKEKQDAQKKADKERAASGNEIIGINEEIKKGGEEATKINTEAANAAKRRAEEAKRLYEQAKRDYLALEKQIQDEHDKATLRAIDYEIKKINEKYDADVAGLKKALDLKFISEAGYTNKLKQVEELRQKGLAEIRAKYAQAPAELIQSERATQRTALAGNDFNNFLVTEAGRLAEQIQVTKDKIELTGGRKRLKLQLDLLQLERDQALLNTELTEEQRQIITERYNQQRSALLTASFQKQAENIINIANQATDALQAINSIANANDERKIEEINNRYTAEEERNRRLLKNKSIDQEVFDKREKQLAEKKEKEINVIKRRQFERQKKIDIANAIISGSQAVLNALSVKPFLPLGLAMAAIAAVKTGAEISNISKQKPQFAKGGLFDGPTHSQGGMPIINPRTGTKVAEIEGGEPILSRNTYANNKPLVDRLLYSSMYQNGKAISPSWQSRPLKTMNWHSMATATQGYQKFANGGVFNEGVSTNTDLPFNELFATLSNVTNSLQNIKAYVVYSEVAQAQELDNKVKNETTISRR